MSLTRVFYPSGVGGGGSDGGVISDNSITDQQISNSANISQNKIENLVADLASKQAATSFLKVPSSGASQDVEATIANIYDITLTANCTVNLVGNGGEDNSFEPVPYHLTVILRQDVTGGRTVTWSNNITWAGIQHALKSTAGAVTLYSFTSIDGGETWIGEDINGDAVLTLADQRLRGLRGFIARPVAEQSSYDPAVWDQWVFWQVDVNDGTPQIAYNGTWRPFAAAGHHGERHLEGHADPITVTQGQVIDLNADLAAITSDVEVLQEALDSLQSQKVETIENQVAMAASAVYQGIPTDVSAAKQITYVIESDVTFTATVEHSDLGVTFTTRVGPLSPGVVNGKYVKEVSIKPTKNVARIKVANSSSPQSSFKVTQIVDSFANYVATGSITDNEIASDAAIAISKIAGIIDPNTSLIYTSLIPAVPATIADNSIVNAKISSSANIDLTKLNGLVNGSGKITSTLLDISDIQIFNSSGTWTKPSKGSIVRVLVVGAGHGGGGGGRNALGVAVGGGGGGSAGGSAEAVYQIGDLPGTVAVTVGNGGNGGAGATSDGVTATTGSYGGNSSFGTYLVAGGGNPGVGGGTAAGTGGSSTAVSASSLYPAAPGAAGGLSAAGANSISQAAGSGGGSGGGAVNSAGTHFAGGTAGVPGTTSTSVAGGTAGGGAGSAGTAATAIDIVLGSGGSGGGGNNAGVGGAGGVGAVPGGGGGGGGAGQGGNGGAGGNGAKGRVIVIVL